MFQITLKQAREAYGYSLEDISAILDVSKDEYISIEGNTENATTRILTKLSKGLNVPLNLIFIGSDANCIKCNRKNCSVVK